MTIETRLQYNILRLPSQARYVAQPTNPGAPSSPNTSSNRDTASISYHYALTSFDRWAAPIQLAHITDYYSFKADMALSDVCTWEIVKRFPSSEYKQAISLLKVAQTPGAFSIWHLSLPEEEDLYDEYLGGSGFNGLIEYTDGVPGLVSGSSDVADSVPSWSQRGGGGLIQDASLMKTADGEWEVKIKSACWGKSLQETITRASVKDSVDKYDLQDVLWDLFTENADYEPALLRDLADGETREDRIQAIEGLGQSIRESGNLPVNLNTMEITGDYRAVTPVGRWLIVPLLTNDARTQVGSDNRWETNYGNHTMLKEIQRLAETAGLLFMTALPYIIFFPAGPRGDIIWDFGKWFQGHQFVFRHLKPRATAWLGTHTDALGGGRSISVHITDNDLVEDYGEIQTSFLTTAPIILADDASEYESGADAELEGTSAEPSGDENDWRVADYATIRHMVEQAHARAIHEKENWTATVELPWLPGNRFGVDWYLGDTIVPYVHGDRMLPSGSSLIVRSANLAIRADGEIRCVAGLGSRADIDPRWADQFLASSPETISPTGRTSQPRSAPRVHPESIPHPSRTNTASNTVKVRSPEALVRRQQQTRRR